MSDTKATATASSGGIGFCGLLTILFIAFKLLGVIDWSWIWVFAPIWITILFVIMGLVVVGFFAILVVIAKYLLDK